MALTACAVESAVEACYGSHMHLQDWRIQPFTKKGDNYSTIVTSIEVTLVETQDQEGTSSNVLKVVKKNEDSLTETDDSKKKQSQSKSIILHHSFVAKFFPDREDGAIRSIFENLHKREGEFFLTIRPRLNTVLQALNKSTLLIPKCYHACYDKRKELLINEDMRKYGYKMADRTIGMNRLNTILVLKELASLHASSYVLRKQNNNEDFEVTYPFTRDFFKDPKHPTIPCFDSIYNGNFLGASEMLRQFTGYEKASAKLLEMVPDLVPKLADQLVNADDRFAVICHGDT